MMETANPPNPQAGPSKLENVQVFLCERCYSLPSQSDEVHRGVNSRAGPLRACSDPIEKNFFTSSLLSKGGRAKNLYTKWEDCQLQSDLGWL
jgi:hypothetical protein